MSRNPIRFKSCPPAQIQEQFADDDDRYQDAQRDEEEESVMGLDEGLGICCIRGGNL